MSSTQKFVPVSQIDPALLNATVLNYRPEYDAAGTFIGLGKPGMDSYQYGFVCDIDETGNITKLRYDALKKLDGPIQEDGHAAPSAIMVVAERRKDGIYLYTAPEKRIFIYDHINKVQGPTVMGFAGGFTEKGKSPRQTALEETLQEHGIEVESASVELIGWFSDNRAMTETCIEVYLGIFQSKNQQSLQGSEVIGNVDVVRIDRFKTGRDGIINAAYACLIDHLHLVKPK